MRKFLQQRFPVEGERAVFPDHAGDADEVFLTSFGEDVFRVAQFEKLFQRLDVGVDVAEFEIDARALYSRSASTVSGQFMVP